MAFDTLKEKLSSPPVLAYADFKEPFIVLTDASLEGLGAILYQEQEGKERVIAYASRGLRNSEKNYPAHKLEFFMSQMGRNINFTIIYTETLFLSVQITIP